MLKHRMFSLIAWLSILCLATAVLAAPQAPDPEPPHRYNPRSLDGALASVTAPNGTVWSAWGYRAGAEYDIAISYLDDSGLWSEPIFIGDGDGGDQVQPALAVDPGGTLYLAYADRVSGGVMFALKPAGIDQWVGPSAASPPGTRAYMPALHVVGNHLVLAYRTGQSIVLQDMLLIAPAVRGRGIQDGPDPFGLWEARNGDDGDGDGQHSGDNDPDPDPTSGGPTPTRDRVRRGD